jgi:hypothetical protein
MHRQQIPSPRGAASSSRRAVLTRVILSVLLLAGFSPATSHGASDDDALPELYWGDTHVHTSYSVDANLFNNFALGPEVAYRFARGEGVRLPSGLTAQLSRPLDFLVVADHAEYLGVISMIRRGDPLVANSETARKIFRLIAENPVFGPDNINDLGVLLNDDPLGADPAIRRRVWDEVIDIAERMNEPGKFTTLVGYEWGTTIEGNNLHRNVIFRDGPERTKTILPFSAMDSLEPEDLWVFLSTYEQRTGGEAFAIPHNSNLSNGLMFSLNDSAGQPIDKAHATLRARYEPVVEVTQIKGDSETHPFLSPDDEFADYERWDKTNIFGLKKTTTEMHVGSYARAALRNGLLIQSRIGVNPYRFAMIGSTDAHTSLATADEGNFWGKTFNMLPGSDRTQGEFIHSFDPEGEPTMNWEQAAAGYAGVWAKENTREAIFDAMRRGEAYATTGPRMRVLFFGGWRFNDTDARSSNLARAGYVKGVPMGADLPPKQAHHLAPTFLLAASRDPESGPLQRIQIVKGWLDEGGETQEKVFDVEIAADSVKGRSEMVSVWTDPGFKESEAAFYYARVIEVPTPRWNAIDAARYRKPLVGARVQHQERAYTSPIWYTPGESTQTESE